MNDHPPTLSTDLAVGDWRREVEQLAQCYGPLVLRTAWRLLPQRELAEELQQDVFLKLLQSPPKDVRSWSAWLTTCTTRMALDRLRRNQRWKRIKSLLHWPTNESLPSPESLNDQQQRSDALREALSQLPPREAQAFCLRSFQGLELIDIANTLNIKRGHAAVILHRARARLADKLGVELETEHD